MYAEFPIENIHDVEKDMRQKRKDVYLKKSYEKGIHLHWHLLKIFLRVKKGHTKNEIQEIPKNWFNNWLLSKVWVRHKERGAAKRNPFVKFF